MQGWDLVRHSAALAALQHPPLRKWGAAAVAGAGRAPWRALAVRLLQRAQAAAAHGRQGLHRGALSHPAQRHEPGRRLQVNPKGVEPGKAQGAGPYRVTLRHPAERHQHGVAWRSPREP